jgi:hypothetical protein
MGAGRERGKRDICSPLDLNKSELNNEVNIRNINYLTTCKRASVEKPTGTQPLKKFPAFYVIQKFIFMFTRT